MCNLLVVHYTADQLEETTRWIDTHCPKQLVVLVERDSSIMDSR